MLSKTKQRKAVITVPRISFNLNRRISLTLLASERKDKVRVKRKSVIY